ncbi:hypothetical protein EJ08DRAFT_702136 [Tothia fuscella]|uniref:mRNA N(6)-methyladenine demethylase n=1 Tax=Tothia fuscella TaxID=1048955 RepID=A0A9P4NGW4_9PEZI|nr:hypothetical protein EJ08DRAFT_702136 [Tothia fuscella]
MTSKPQKHLNPHAKPPEKIRELYKKCQKLKPDELADSPLILDMERNDLKTNSHISIVGEMTEDIDSIFQIYADNYQSSSPKAVYPISIYAHDAVPGLRLVPNLIPRSVQIALLNKLIHRDLSNPLHKSNVHLHHNVTYVQNEASFFSVSPSSDLTFTPKDPSIHKPISISQFLNKKLRWITLGGQYDWTNKIYPEENPPAFPEDTADLLKGLFPELTPQAAIVNFYSPGVTLSLHRDVAEECDRGLLSVSIGCDGIFILGLESEDSQKDDIKAIAIRLRSGDAVYMDGKSRFAWHGVPQIVGNTCPDWLRDWPAGGKEVGGVGIKYEDWRGWMGNKRINLNVRQMWD